MNVKKKSSGYNCNDFKLPSSADVCALRMGSYYRRSSCSDIVTSLLFNHSFLMAKCGNGHTDSTVFLRPACIVLAMSCEYIR